MVSKMSLIISRDIGFGPSSEKRDFIDVQANERTNVIFMVSISRWVFLTIGQKFRRRLAKMSNAAARCPPLRRTLKLQSAAVLYSDYFRQPVHIKLTVWLWLVKCNMNGMVYRLPRSPFQRAGLTFSKAFSICLSNLGSETFVGTTCNGMETKLLHGKSQCDRFSTKAIFHATYSSHTPDERQITADPYTDNRDDLPPPPSHMPPYF